MQRRLDALARLSRREPYRRALAEHRAALGLRELHLGREGGLDHPVRSAMTRVYLREQVSGNGFLVAPDLVATNLLPRAW